MSIPSPNFPPPASVHKSHFIFLVKLRNKNSTQWYFKGVIRENRGIKDQSPNCSKIFHYSDPNGSE